MGVLRSALEDHCGFVDDDAIRQLLASAYLLAPDVTEAELALLVAAKGALIHRQGVRNPLGFLLTAVPKCLEGAGLASLRHFMAGQEANDVGFAGTDAIDWRSKMRGVLADPASSEEDIRFANRLLGLEGQ